MNCPSCQGCGAIRAQGAMTNEAACDIEECPDCHGSGDVVGCVVCEDAEPVEGSDRCARCSDMSACANPPTSDPADAIPFDDEPVDIDSDDGFDVYAGGPESPYDDGDAGDWYGDE